MRTLLITDREKIEKIIRSCRTCFLGLCDGDLKPYVVPMNFSLDGDYIYMHSAQEGRKWEMMNKNPNACVTFLSGDTIVHQNEEVACSWRVRSKTVIAEGELEFIDDYFEKEKALKIFMSQYSDRDFSFNAPAVKNVGIFRLKIKNISGKEFGAKAVTPWNS
ncbi:MAG: pyridoxamine 5'-phosphate oxidase family protein [Prolixibacteraceae bacterium]|nr:pyridoxamine 5'-phosphate oxidase family protein [Prolixibacteraceae bacterium]